MQKKLVLAALGLIIFLSAGAARARIGDFAVRPAISVGNTITALDFTPNGRFLVILSGNPGTVRFFDTWDMALLSGATADVSVATGATVALSLTVSPYAALPFAYVGLSTGRVVVIDYTKVAALGALDELTSELPVTSFSVGTTPVAQILAAPEFLGKTANVYLLLGLPTNLSWVRLAAGTNPGPVTINAILRAPIALARGAKYAYVLSVDTGTSQSYLNEMECTDTNQTCFPLTSLLAIGFPSTDVFSGLVADGATDIYSVTMNRTQKKEFLMGNFPVPAVLDNFTVADAVALTAAPTPFDAALGDVVLAAGGDTVSVAALSNSGLLFGGSYQATNAGTPLTTMVASGGSEGYAFAGGTGGDIVPFTANPWVNLFTSTNSGSTINLQFSVSSKAIGNLHYAVFKNIGFRKWSTNISTGTVVYADTVTTATLPTTDLAECQNALTLIVQDSYGRQGRAVTAAVKDTNPPAPNFTLGFGAKSLVVDFTVSKLCDLNHYGVFWGDTNTLPVTDYLLLATHGGSMTVPSPIAGTHIEKVIPGLTDGQRYYVQLVAFDNTGNAGVSSRLSSVPQTVTTLTGAAGEKGGFNCLGSIGGGGDPRGLVGLFLPLLIYAVLRVSRREKR